MVHSTSLVVLRRFRTAYSARWLFAHPAMMVGSPGVLPPATSRLVDPDSHRGTPPRLRRHILTRKQVPPETPAAALGTGLQACRGDPGRPVGAAEPADGHPPHEPPVVTACSAASHPSAVPRGTARRRRRR